MAYKSVALAVTDKRTKLEAAKAALKDAEQLVRDLEVELRTWTEVEALLSKQIVPEKQSSLKPEKLRTEEVTKGKKRTSRKRGSTKTKRTRAPKGYWLSTMEKLAVANSDFSLSDVGDTATTIGTSLNPTAIRSQMAKYVESGSLTRVKNGVFRFTSLGYQTFKSSPDNEMASQKSKAELQNSNLEDRALEETVP